MTEQSQTVSLSRTESNGAMSSRPPCLEPLKMASTSTPDRTASLQSKARLKAKRLKAKRLKAKRKIRKVVIRELLFADDAALTSHSAESLQRLRDRFADACKELGLTISLKKTKIMGQDVCNAPSININEHTLEVVQDFTYLGSTITSNLSTDVEINKRIGKASSAMSRMTSRAWEIGALTLNTRVQVYKAFVILLYGSETWTTYAKQEHRRNTFHLRRICGIKWQDHISNTEVLKLPITPACILSSASVSCDGSATCVAWRMIESQKTSSTVTLK